LRKPQRYRDASLAQMVREVVERDAETVTARYLGGDVIVSAAQVLHEGMSRGENPARAVALQLAHRPQPCFQPLADYAPWFDNHKRLRELVAELEELSLAIAENDPRWNR
jgi:hypothetical protein